MLFFAVYFGKTIIYLNWSCFELNFIIIFFIILFGIKQLIIITEEDILNYSPTGIIRGTP